MQSLGKRSERVKNLRRRVRRRRHGEVVVDGCKLVDDLVRWGMSINELYLAASVAATESVATWLAASAETFVLDDTVLAEIAPTRSPQGVLAVVEEPRWPAWDGRHGLAVWLDGVQDPGNLGAIVRVAAGLGGAAVLCGPGCADPFAPAAVRGAAGAVFRVAVERSADAARAADLVREGGGEVWAATTDGAPLETWRPARPLLLMLGAEGRGLSSEVLALADGRISIALDRGVESLNVAVAAGVMLARARYCERESIFSECAPS